LKFQAEIREAHPASGKVLLVSPMLYMNRSGEPVQQIARFYQVEVEEIAVICDDMNLPLGRLRWRPGGSSGGQKGLADILARLGTEKVSRLRLGVGRPPGNMDPSHWVLARFRSEDRSEAEMMTKLAADSVECWLAEGIVGVMNRFNKASEV
jgi:PTH1 family peptidyl-tRNA hydrolase